MIVLVVTMVFVLRPKNDIVPPSGSSVQTSSSNGSQAPAIISSHVAPSLSTPNSNSQPNESEETIPDALSFKATPHNYCRAITLKSRKRTSANFSSDCIKSTNKAGAYEEILGKNDRMNASRST